MSSKLLKVRQAWFKEKGFEMHTLSAGWLLP
jgi:hypothetical protein